MLDEMRETECNDTIKVISICLAKFQLTYLINLLIIY